MGKIIAVIIAAVIIILGIIFIPKVVHTCSDCEKMFIGACYEPNIISELLSSKEGDEVICKDCAEEQHALSIALGKSLDEFKKDLF